MLFGVTELQNDLRCQRKHYLTSFNFEGWTPIWPSTALHLGTLVHRVGAIWLMDPTTQVPLGQIFYDEAAKDLETLIRIHFDILNHAPTALQQDDYWTMAHLGQAMMDNYQAFYKTPLPHNFKLLQPEQTVSVPIPGTKHCASITKSDPENKYCSCNDCRCHLKVICKHMDGCTCEEYHYLEGTLDAIILDPTDRLFVFERKTYGQRPNLRELQRNWQFLAYIWLLTKTRETGGIAYDGLWKREVPPKGKMMSDLFFRHFMLRNVDELEEFETDLAELTNEIAVRPRNKIPRRTIPAVRGCIDCYDMIDYCDAISFGEEPPLHKYVKRELTPIFKDFYGVED